MITDKIKEKWLEYFTFQLENIKEWDDLDFLDTSLTSEDIEKLLQMPLKAVFGELPILNTNIATCTFCNTEYQPGHTNPYCPKCGIMEK